MIIGIGGCSRSGKTTLAETLVWHYRTQNKTAIALHQDDFVKKIKELPLIQNQADWEHPASVDFALLQKAIMFFKESFDVVILEGILVFADAQMNLNYDCCFFTTISKETFYKRRLAETRWGKEPEWFLEHVWESFLKYGQPPLIVKNMMVLDGENPYQMEKIEEFLRHIGNGL